MGILLFFNIIHSTSDLIRSLAVNKQIYFLHCIPLQWQPQRKQTNQLRDVSEVGIYAYEIIIIQVINVHTTFPG